MRVSPKQSVYFVPAVKACIDTSGVAPQHSLMSVLLSYPLFLRLQHEEGVENRPVCDLCAARDAQNTDQSKRLPVDKVGLLKKKDKDGNTPLHITASEPDYVCHTLPKPLLALQPLPTPSLP